MKASSRIRHEPDLSTWLQSLCLFQFASIAIQPASSFLGQVGGPLITHERCQSLTGVMCQAQEYNSR